MNNQQIAFQGSRQELVEAVKKRYGNQEGIRYLTSAGFIRSDGAGNYEGVLPGVDYFLETPGIVNAWDSIDTISSYYDLSVEERRCIFNRAIELHGSIDLIFPFDTYSDCIDDRLVSTAQQEILNDILRRFDSADITVAVDSTSPVKDAHYRGWYYCYRNTNLCAGRRNIYWWQRPSKFRERNGQHGGVDLIGDDQLDSTDLYAVVSGRLSFSNHDGAGWGNALLLPFKSNGDTLFAVYAHLPDSASSFNNRRVQKGASIGTTGCTGNAGDGNGSCNTFCKWAGSNRTDEHLHFEIIKKNDDGEFEKIDPFTIVDFAVQDGGRRFRANCAR